MFMLAGIGVLELVAPGQLPAPPTPRLAIIYIGLCMSDGVATW